MKQKKLQEITDISDHEYEDTSDMDSEARKIYFLSTIVSALLTTVTAWTLFFMFTEMDDLWQLIKCGIYSMVIPVVFFSIFMIREKGNDYLKIVPCLRYTSRFNWTMTAAPLFLIIYDFIKFGFNMRMPGGVYTYTALLAFCFILSLFAAKHASQSYNKEEPFHAMISTYTNDNAILWWAAFLGIAAAVIILVLGSDWFNS